VHSGRQVRCRRRCRAGGRMPYPSQCGGIR